MPGTPEKKRKFSRRAWDGAIRQWKLRVHAESRKVMENSSKTGHHMDPFSKAGSNSDVKMDRRAFADSNIDSKTNEHGQDQGVDDISQNKSGEAEGATATAGDIVEVKLEYKVVEEELLHPDDPKEEDGEVVETRKAETEQVKIITI